MLDTPEHITLAVLNEQLRYLITRVDALMLKVEHQADASHARDLAMSMIQKTLDCLPTLEKRLIKTEDAIAKMRPWVSGVRWFALIVGGAIAMAVVGGVLWAVMQWAATQSGAGLP